MSVRSEGTTQGGEAKRAGKSSLRVLIVDDNRDAADLVAALLAVRGHEVVIAYSAPEAIQKAQEQPFDVAFFDLGMPLMDGCTLAQVFRTDDRLKDVGLVALTGWGTPADRARTARAGFDVHLVKPAGLDQLEKAIATIVARRSPDGSPPLS